MIENTCQVCSAYQGLCPSKGEKSKVIPLKNCVWKRSNANFLLGSVYSHLPYCHINMISTFQVAHDLGMSEKWARKLFRSKKKKKKRKLFSSKQTLIFWTCMTGWTSAQAVCSLVGHRGRAQEYWTESEEVGSVSVLCSLLGTWPWFSYCHGSRKVQLCPHLESWWGFLHFAFVFVFWWGKRRRAISVGVCYKLWVLGQCKGSYCALKN